MEWLREELSDGPVHATDLQERAEVFGLSWTTVRRAQKKLGVRPTKNGYSGPWVWTLPGQEQEGRTQKDDEHTKDPPNGANSNNLAIFEDQKAEDPNNEATFAKAATSREPGHLRGDKGQTKAANDPSSDHLRERSSGVSSFSDPRPEDGQDSGTGHLCQKGTEPDLQDSDERCATVPGGGLATISVGLIDGDRSRS